MKTDLFARPFSACNQTGIYLLVFWLLSFLFANDSFAQANAFADKMKRRDVFIKDQYLVQASLSIDSDEKSNQFKLNGQTSIDLEKGEFIQYGWCVEPIDQPLVCFRNGSRVSVSRVALAGGGCKIESRSLLPVTVSGNDLQAVLFRPVGIGKRYDLQMQLLEKVGGSDTIYFSNGDQINGKVVGIDNVQSNSVTFLARGETSTFNINRIDAVVFADEKNRESTAMKQSGAIWEAALHDGSIIYCKSFQYDEKSVQFKCDSFECRFAREFPTANLISEFSGLRNLSGKKWLTDFSIARIQRSSPIRSSFTVRKGKAVDKSKLRIRSRLYENGLGMLSNTNIVFKFDETYESFQALVGYDDSAPVQCEVLCRVLKLDRENQWKIAAEAKVTGNNQLPLYVTANIKNCSAIALQILPSDDGENT